MAFDPRSIRKGIEAAPRKYVKKIQDCVSVKPGKVSVKVEKMEE